MIVAGLLKTLSFACAHAPLEHVMMGKGGGVRCGPCWPQLCLDRLRNPERSSELRRPLRQAGTLVFGPFAQLAEASRITVQFGRRQRPASDGRGRR